MGTRKLTISHKRNDCIGCGSCAQIAPHTWRMSREDGKAILIGSRWHGKEFMVASVEDEPSRTEDNHAAAAACPVRIIRIGNRSSS